MPTMISLNDFFTPRLVGQRFDHHTIPLELLKELAVLEEMLIEVAKWCYRQKNPDRKRAPKGFSEGVSLHLTEVSEGSAIPGIALVMPSGDLVPPHSQAFYEQARELIIGAVAAGESKTDAKRYLPSFLLGFFDRLGRGLRDQEYIEFSPHDPDRPARLSKESRKYLVACSNVKEVTEEVLLRGTIPSVDQSKMNFKFQIIGGSTVPAPLHEQHLETVLQGVNEYRHGGKVLLQGIGRFNRDERLQSIESVEHLSVLDVMDVAARLEEFKSLKEGWLDGQHGLAFANERLDWLAAQFDRHYPDDLPLPYLYPTAEGGVQAEWSLADRDITLDMDLATGLGEWHSLGMKNGQDFEKPINLMEDDGWQWLAEQIRTLEQNDHEG